MSKTTVRPEKPPRRIINVGPPLNATPEQRAAAFESPEYKLFIRLLAKLAIDKTRRRLAAEAAAQAESSEDPSSFPGD